MEIHNDSGSLILHHTLQLDGMDKCQIREAVLHARSADAGEFYLSAVAANAAMYAQSTAAPIWQ